MLSVLLVEKWIFFSFFMIAEMKTKSTSNLGKGVTFYECEDIYIYIYIYIQILELEVTFLISL